MNIATDWTPGAVALGLATAIGIFMALRVRHATRRPVDSADAGPRAAITEDLLRQRDALYEQIRALDADPGWRADDRAGERHRLVIEAARTLQALDVTAAHTALPGSSPTSHGTSPATSPAVVKRSNPWVNAAIGGGAGVFGAMLVLGIQDFTKEKPAMGPGPGGDQRPAGDGLTGMSPTNNCEAEIAAARMAADAAPDDVHTRLVYARSLLDCDDVKGAFDQTQLVTNKDPDNADARTLQAVVLLQIGDVDMASGLLDKVIALHPDHVEALGYRGAVYLNAGDKEKAIAAWERVIALDPSQTEAVSPLIAMARTGKNPFGSAPVVGGTSAPLLGAAPSSPSAAPTPSDISGTINCQACAPGSAPYVFIYLRPAGQDRGPPAAAKKLEHPTFPIEFRLGPADSPMGGAFPEDGTLAVRVDMDGNPTTREPGAPEGRAEHVKPGQVGVGVVLQVN